MSLRQLPHLIRRFWGSIRAQRPGPQAQAQVAAELGAQASTLFFAQPAMDQAHAFRVARRVAGAAANRADLVRAALLHDVGKTAARLGIVGRSIASLLAMLHLPAPERMRRYLDHGPAGATLLVAVGESGIVVAFARQHHESQAPPGVDPADWATLRIADHE